MTLVALELGSEMPDIEGVELGVGFMVHLNNQNHCLGNNSEKAFEVIGHRLQNLV